MAAAAASHLKCPVCHDGFTVPKLLPCTHLVCCKCVLSWLEKGGDENGCPLCRAPILPESARAQGDLASLVDALPTDLATAAMVESSKTLNGGHTCGCCEDEGASLFCLQCGIKLCSSCAKTHAKIPSTRDHVTEKLDELSAEQLALHYHVPCANHSTEQARLYCTSHEELTCLLCAASAHRKCCDVEGIEAVANVKREELKAEVKKLEEKEAALTDKINKLDIEVLDAQAKFKAMKDNIRVTFNDLQRSLEAQREKLNSDVQQREETFLAERKSFKLELENHKSDLSAHRSTAERVATNAPDSSLLGMIGKLKARLDALKSQDLPKDPEMAVGSLIFKPDTVKMVKEALAVIGRLTDPSTTKQTIKDDRCFWCGKLLALEVEVGDRIGRGRNISYGSYEYSQPRMPFHGAMSQPQQLGFMQPYGHANAPYLTNPYFFLISMPMPNTSRPSSTGSQGAMGPKPQRNRKVLSVTDPTTGEDLTEKVFNPTGGKEVDPAVAESQMKLEMAEDGPTPGLGTETKVAADLTKDRVVTRQTTRYLEKNSGRRDDSRGQDLERDPLARSGP